MKKFKGLKKIAVFSLVAVMLCSAFGGCGKKQEKAGGEIPIIEGEFVPQKDLELTVWQTQGTDYIPADQPKENVVENWLVDRTRVKIVNAYGNGGGSWDAMLSRLVVGDNFPELMACGGGQGPTQHAKLKETDMIWELTPEMIQKYCPDVWERVPSDWWERIKVDGKIYGIPSGNIENGRPFDDASEEDRQYFLAAKPQVHTGIWVRDDILKTLHPEAYNFDEAAQLVKDNPGRKVGDEICDAFSIKSIDEFVDFLYEIKALDLKIGNKPVYVMGYTQPDDAWVPMVEVSTVMTGHQDHFYPTTWNNKTKEVEMTLFTDWLKENMLLQNRLVRDGIVDPESLMHTSSQYTEKALNGQYALINIGYVKPPAKTVAEVLEERGMPFKYVPLCVAIDPIEGYERVNNPYSWLNTLSILKTVPAEDVPQILNWINTQFTDEFSETYYWGPKEAELYTTDENGKRWFKNDKLNDLWIRKTGGVTVTLDEKMGINMMPGLYAFYEAKREYRHDYFNKTYAFNPDHHGFSFRYNGKYATDYELAPSGNIWESIYANIPEVQEFWNARTTWEDPFRLTLTAKSDEEFNEKWDLAVKNVKSMVDTDKMIEEMNKAAKEFIGSK